MSKSLKNAQVESANQNSLVQLTYSQRQKFNYLSSIYSDKDALIELVKLIDGRGRNSWTKINAKISFINDGNRDTQKYLDALYDNFDLLEVYDSDVIISIIGQVRRDLGLEPYITRIKKYCEEDFFNLFVVHEKHETTHAHDSVQSKFIGYIPMFKLKPED